jgi:hypothetical protein
MRSRLVVLFIVAVVLTIPMSAFAGGYFAIGGGAGGDADAPNVSIEIGSVSTGRNPDILMALGFGFIFNTDDVPSDTLDYPIPHWDYTSLGKRQKGNEYCLFGKLGMGIKGIFIYGLGGVSFAEEIELAQSNVTGWYYEQSSSTEAHGMYGGGLALFIPGSRVSLQAEYDNRRGVTGGVGFRW